MNNQSKTLIIALTGSKLYGLDLPGSDTDLVEVRSDSVSEMIGLSRPAKGRHTIIGDDDRTVWGFTHFVNTMLGGSTNATDILFAPPGYRTLAGGDYYNPADWQEVYDNRRAFLGRATRNSYLGHAQSAARAANNPKPELLTGPEYEKQFAKSASMSARMLYQLEALLTDAEHYTPRLTGEALAYCRAVKTGEVSIPEFQQWFSRKLAQVEAMPCDWEADLGTVEGIKVKLSVGWISEFATNNAPV